MKILYHQRILSRDGQLVHIEELVNALRALEHEVTVVGPGPGPEESSDSGGPRARRLLPRPVAEALEFGYNAVAFARLAAAWLRNRPDALYERYNLFLLAGTWLKMLTGCPFVVEVNAPFSKERRAYGGLAFEALARSVERHVWQRADAVIVVTQALAADVMAAGVAPDRIVVIPNGIDPARFAAVPPTEAAKARLGLAGTLVLGFTGFPRDWHRLERVIDYIADAPGGDHLRLLIVGDGPMVPTLKRHAATRHVAERIIFAGVVPRERVGDYVAAFDVALQPHATPYASPLKMVEYMALGRTIVAPDLPNIRELMVHRENAILFNLNDDGALLRALDEVLADPMLRQRLGEGARRTIAEKGLTWRHNAERTIACLATAGAR